MKALTIKQPWADAIVFGAKRVENRTWATGYRGCLVIHAGKALDPDGLTVVRRIEGPQWDNDLEPLGQTGALLGLATLVDVHPWAPGCCSDPYAVREAGTFHWVVRAPIALPEPIAAKGQLGLWQVPHHLAEQITAAAGARPNARQFR